MAQNYIDQIIINYEESRNRAQAERDRRRREIYKKHPRLEEISREIKRTGMEQTKKIILHPDQSEEILAQMRQKMTELEAEKKRLIEENGIDPDFDRVRYQCELCQDTGYVENKKCSCFVQKLLQYEYESSNMGALLEEHNFDRFRMDFYSEEPLPGETISPREYIENAYKNARNFCEHFETAKSLLFYGETGLGKTFLSSCIGKEMMDRGKTVLYVRAARLFSIYDDYKFNRDDSRVGRDMIDKVYECDLLIIDDLGSEFRTKNSVAFLLDILNERIPANKKMIISTNLKPSGLGEMYSMRFTSRIFEGFDILKFSGQDIRMR